MPKDRVASYYNPQPKIKTDANGKRTYRVRGTYGGDRGDYAGDTQAFTASMAAVKVLLNSVISDEADWLTADIKDFYLGTPVERYEYMRITRAQIPQCIIDEFELEDIFENDVVMMELHKGIYGLKQAGILAQKQLFKHLEEHGYTQCPNTPAVFCHKDRPTKFAVVVDDFGIKVGGAQKDRAENTQHLLDTLRKKYIITVDTYGKQYLGININVNHKAHTVTMDMRGYMPKILRREGIAHEREIHTPANYQQPRRGPEDLLVAKDDISPLISAERALTYMRLIGGFQYYVCSIESAWRPIISKLAQHAAKPTEKNWEELMWLCQHAYTHPNGSIVYRASDMQLKGHTDGSHQSEKNSRSRAAAYFYFGSADVNDTTDLNGAILVDSAVISVVTASAAETEYAATFMGAINAEALRTIATDLGHPQGPTPLITDNKTVDGIVNNTCKQRRSKAMDMRFNWVRDRVGQGHFLVMWRRGKDNYADFFSKIHPNSYYREQKLKYTPESE